MEENTKVSLGIGTDAAKDIDNQLTSGMVYFDTRRRIISIKDGSSRHDFSTAESLNWIPCEYAYEELDKLPKDAEEILVSVNIPMDIILTEAGVSDASNWVGIFINCTTNLLRDRAKGENCWLSPRETVSQIVYHDTTGVRITAGFSYYDRWSASFVIDTSDGETRYFFTPESHQPSLYRKIFGNLTVQAYRLAANDMLVPEIQSGFAVVPNSLFDVDENKNIRGRINMDEATSYDLQFITIPCDHKVLSNAFFDDLVECLLICDSAKLESKSFVDCTRLRRLIIGKNVELDSDTFFNCPNISEVFYIEDLDKLKSSISDTAKYYQIANVPQILDANSTATLYRIDNSNPNIVVPRVVDGYIITSIYIDFFSLHEQTKNIKLSDYIVNVSCKSKERCINYYVSANNALYTFYEKGGLNCLIEKGSCKLVSACADGSVELPSDVKIVGSAAFYNCSSLESITIPNSVTSIEDNAFWSCSSLESITIPEGVTSIGRYAFAYCSKLVNIEIPDSVTSIGSYAFRDCSSLTSIKIPENLLYILPGTFRSCTSLTSIEIPSSVCSIESETFYNCIKLNEVTFSSNSNLTTIGERAFERCKELKNISIPEGVSKIGQHAFDSCEQLTEITLPSNIGGVEKGLFKDCKNLQTVNLGKSVTSIGPYVFLNNSSLKTVYIGSNQLKLIASYAFSNCPKLESIFFYGSNEDWNNISKQANWNYNVQFGYTVYFVESDVTPDDTKNSDLHTLLVSDSIVDITTEDGCAQSLVSFVFKDRVGCKGLKCVWEVELYNSDGELVKTTEASGTIRVKDLASDSSNFLTYTGGYEFFDIDGKITRIINNLNPDDHEHKRFPAYGWSEVEQDDGVTQVLATWIFPFTNDDLERAGVTTLKEAAINGQLKGRVRDYDYSDYNISNPNDDVVGYVGTFVVKADAEEVEVVDYQGNVTSYDAAYAEDVTTSNVFLCPDKYSLVSGFSIYITPDSTHEGPCIVNIPLKEGVGDDIYTKIFENSVEQVNTDEIKLVYNVSLSSQESTIYHPVGSLYMSDDLPATVPWTSPSKEFNIRITGITIEEKTSEEETGYWRIDAKAENINSDFWFDAWFGIYDASVTQDQLSEYKGRVGLSAWAYLKTSDRNGYGDNSKPTNMVSFSIESPRKNVEASDSVEGLGNDNLWLTEYGADGLIGSSGIGRTNLKIIVFYSDGEDGNGYSIAGESEIFNLTTEFAAEIARKVSNYEYSLYTRNDGILTSGSASIETKYNSGDEPILDSPTKLMFVFDSEKAKDLGLTNYSLTCTNLRIVKDTDSGIEELHKFSKNDFMIDNINSGCSRYGVEYDTCSSISFGWGQTEINIDEDSDQL